MSTNYVIACYMGPRRCEDPRQFSDRSFFLKTHLNRLLELEHKLDQVTVVLATGGDGETEEEAETYAKQLTAIGDTKIVVLTRENAAFSYGSWEHAFLTFGKEFSHYILVEDDYVPCVNNFDRTLVEISERKNTYVCALTAWEKTHAAISNSIATSALLSDVFPSNLADGLDAIPRTTSGFYSQLIWSRLFYEKHHTIEDWTDTYASPFWNGWELRWYGHPALPCVFLPIQAIDREVGIADGVSCRLSATMTRWGEVLPSTSEDATMWDEFLSRKPNDSRWAFPPMLSKPFYWESRS